MGRRRHWPLALGLLVLWGTMAALIAVSVGRNGGHFVYALDDAYIHMAVAKNLVRHGVWGVTPYEFTSASSSLLWPLLLAGVYAVVGVNEPASLVLNLLAATALLVVAYAALRRAGAGRAFTAFALVELTFLAPLPWAVFLGMEHALQAAVGVGFLCLAGHALAAEKGSWRGSAAGLLVLAPVVTALRYEGVALAGAVAVLAMARRRWLYGVALGGLALLPLAVYGGISWHMGWSWLPNSVILKALLYQLPLGQRFIHPGLLVLPLVLVPLFLLRWERVRFWEPGQVMIALCLAAWLAQTLAGYPDLRYDVHLVAMGVVAAGVAITGHLQAGRLAGWRRSAAGVGVMALLLLPPLGMRVATITRAVPSSTNIYQQQYQMGRFLARYYRGQGVALNDIGAACYLADIHLLDLWGLGSQEVATARLLRGYDRPEISRFAERRGVGVAVFYYRWFGMLVPADWRGVGRWTIPNNVACGSPLVNFMAVRPGEAGRLRRHLVEFAPELPPGVTWGLD